jgi:hypothetical protein
MLWRWLFGALLAAVAGLSDASGDDGAWMTGTDISQAFVGKTIEGWYVDGRPFTERYGPDSRLAYSESGRTIVGRWSITAGTLCTIYDTDPTGGCFRVSRVSENCFVFYFVARAEEAVPRAETSDLYWVARGSISGEAATCPDGASV